MESLLSVKDLHTEFKLDEGIVNAVDGVSFDVKPGQVVGIVGESGCGKSATVKSILRIIEAPGQITRGSILFHRKSDEIVDLARLKARGKQMRSIRGGEISLIPQEPMAAFSPVHTVGNQLIEAVRLHQTISQRDARMIAVEKLGLVGVPDPAQCLDAYSWQLSGGLRQRAMIGMALSSSPSLLIADEPTTAIDVTTQAQVLSLLRKLQQDQGMAMIFITHDLGVIAQLADQVVVMYLGKVVESGPIDDIFHSAQHPYTQALLRSVPTLNAQNRTRLPTIEGALPHSFERSEGCAFFGRCNDAIPNVCEFHKPNLVSISPQQQVSCFLHQNEGQKA